jgi:hypothetical protein
MLRTTGNTKGKENTRRNRFITKARKNESPKIVDREQ